MRFIHLSLVLLGVSCIPALAAQAAQITITADGANDKGCGCAQGLDSTCGYPLSIPCDGKCHLVGKAGDPPDACYKYLSWRQPDGYPVESVTGYPYGNCKASPVDMTDKCGNFGKNKGCRIKCVAGSNGSGG